ncbi:FMRFamide-activated amiloride-sensitive sodium channel [Fasciolopsis buskii]|uniref:FMRFamide-activated amiloride-sensitive sodium channel n=1 Tax=Fasciolopsis buskii TaxID=27845 RepID=A0A8E0S5A2_9TREM|nr:FMRFamide-activated amiloride-sensitive sodium channel [Fasciolopsis buski]
MLSSPVEKPVKHSVDCNRPQDSGRKSTISDEPIKKASKVHQTPHKFLSFRRWFSCTGIAQPASKIKLFGEISSIRGVQRIFRAETPFIRMLWILFVISMTCLLTISSFMLIVDYLQYTTSWHTRTLPDDKSEFPAITLCAHNPFSLRANRLWSTGEVISPNQVKSQMAAISLQMLNQDKVEDSVIMALSDSFEFYYTNLSPEDSQKISHDFAIIPHCILYSPEHTVVAEKCEMENVTPVVRRIFSHPKYFNCLTIEGGRNETTTDISRLVLLAHLVPSSEVVPAKSSFIMDTFTRGEGIKVVIHERNTYPQIERYGFNVQPNRMNEIIYETISWKRLSTPVAPCRDSQTPISDLGVNYTYETSQCLDIATQAEMIQRCGCMNSEWPRPVQAVRGLHHVPYCTSMNRNMSVQDTATVLSKRLACSRIFFDELPGIRERIIRAGICIPRCRFFTYDTKLSVTSWEPSPVKLSSYTNSYRIVEEYLTDPNELRKKALANFLQSIIDPTVNSSSEQLNKRIGDYKQFGDGTYTYISLIRRDFETTLKEERLVFDAHILLSRIGGLCSLCIGLTMAFFIEIIEFIYAVFHTKESNHSNSKNNLNHAKESSNLDLNKLSEISAGQRHSLCVPLDNVPLNQPTDVQGQYIG